jgi:hypothetical protein
MSQLESILDGSSPSTLASMSSLLPSNSTSLHASAAALSASDDAMYLVSDFSIELSGLRCDVMPSAARLISLLNMTNRFIAAGRHRDGSLVDVEGHPVTGPSQHPPQCRR